ncbi:MAG: MerR family transcriptional regulator [Acidimicrobiales bacterium]
MRIGELADTIGVNTQTVQYYESVGLMHEPGRTSSGYRDYGPDALERLQFIRDAQASGLTLTEIRSILELKDAGHGTCDHPPTPRPPPPRHRLRCPVVVPDAA